MLDLPLKGHVFVVAGPTASGKSAFALRAAQRSNGELINADSQQIYKGLPLLTAQPTQIEGISHHLYAFLPPSHPGFSVAQWIERVTPLLHDMLQRNKTPWVVGGTGFYLKALMEGLSPMPSLAPEEVTSWRMLHHEQETAALKKELLEKDPELGKSLQDRQRLLRALSIYDLTGKPLSWWQKQPKTACPFTFVPILVWPNRTRLSQKAEKRYDAMLEGGVKEEVLSFAQTQDLKSSPLRFALGFQDILAMAQGQLSEKECRKRYLQATQAYMKRQRTWFAHQFSPRFIVS
jgi:tRNA dimethylallyltransferase